MKKPLNSKELFKNRVHQFAKKIGITIEIVSIRPMVNKWASCSTNGNMNFNIELLELNKKLSDYVIIHELLHLKAPNHSKLWKSLMRAYLGDYEKLEHKLKKLTNRQVGG